MKARSRINCFWECYKKQSRLQARPHRKFSDCVCFTFNGERYSVVGALRFNTFHLLIQQSYLTTSVLFPGFKKKVNSHSAISENRRGRMRRSCPVLLYDAHTGSLCAQGERLKLGRLELDGERFHYYLYFSICRCMFVKASFPCCLGQRRR